MLSDFGIRETLKSDLKFHRKQLDALDAAKRRQASGHWRRRTDRASVTARAADVALLAGEDQIHESARVLIDLCREHGIRGVERR